jgi:hypothetical protein
MTKIDRPPQALDELDARRATADVLLDAAPLVRRKLAVQVGRELLQ